MSRLTCRCRAGDDGILKAMRRGYTVEDYRRLTGRIRNRIPQMALTTDIIVGFPGESEQQFRNTADLLAELKLDAVHVRSLLNANGHYRRQRI